MYKVKNNIAPVNLRNLFEDISDIHLSYSTKSAAASNFYIKHSRLVSCTKALRFKFGSQSVEWNTNTFKTA